MDASNIKAVAPHLSSEQVQQLLDWMDVRGSERVVTFPDNAVSRGGQVVACMRLGLRAEFPDPRSLQAIGFDLSTKPDTAVEAIYHNGRIVTVEARKLSDD